jgi:hypothetical protein
MRTRSRILFVASVAFTLALTALPARACQVTDPNDVPGKLDLKVLHGDKASSNAPLYITVRTFDGWAGSVLRDTDTNRIRIQYDVDGDRVADYTGVISKCLKLHMDISGSGSSFEPLPVSHPNAHTIKTIVPGGSPPNPNGVVWIRALSRFTNAGACAATCRDHTAWLKVT